MLLGETEQGAPRPPYPPRQGHRPCTRSAKNKTDPQTVFRMLLEGNGMSAHGRNENVEKSRSGKYTFLPVFPHFHGKQTLRPAVFHTAQPVGGRQWRIQLAKKQSTSAKGFLRGGCAASNSQSHNVPFAKGFLRVAVAHPIRKNTFVLGKSMCACCFVSPGHCSCVENCYFRLRVKGRCPLWGAGAKPRTAPQSPPGHYLYNMNFCFRKMGAGTMSLLGPGQCPGYLKKVKFSSSKRALSAK